MIFDTLPNDPIILLSFINTKLRDEYSSLNALCDDFNVNTDAVKAKLGTIGYVYDVALNQFV